MWVLLCKLDYPVSRPFMKIKLNFSFSFTTPKCVKSTSFQKENRKHWLGWIIIITYFSTVLKIHFLRQERDSLEVQSTCCSCRRWRLGPQLSHDHFQIDVSASSSRDPASWLPPVPGMPSMHLDACRCNKHTHEIKVNKYLKHELPKCNEILKKYENERTKNVGQLLP